MTEDEWIKFITIGNPSSASVGRLDEILCREIGASNNLIRIRHDYVLKILQKHKIQPDRLGLIDLCLMFGRVVTDRKKHLTFFHYDEVVFGGWHQLTIKCAGHGTELWFCTFHPQTPSEVRRITGKGKLIRPEKA